MCHLSAMNTIEPTRIETMGMPGLLWLNKELRQHQSEHSLTKLSIDCLLSFGGLLLFALFAVLFATRGAIL